MNKTKTKNVTNLVKEFNENYETNSSTVCQYLTSYIHSRHRIYSQKMDGAEISYQPSFPDKIVQSYRIYYDAEMAYAHKSGRIVLTFTDGTESEIGLFKFKRYLRQLSKYYIPMTINFGQCLYNI